MKSLFNDSRNAIQLVATLAIALSGAVVTTQEATQFNDQASSMSRAQFKAEIAIAQDDGSRVTRGEATQSANGTNASGRDRVAARAEAHAAARVQKLNGYNIGG